MYAHGHKRSNRAVARADKFEASLRKPPDKPPGDKFELVQRLYSADTPVSWKRRLAFLGPVQLMQGTGKLTDAGKYLETLGWVPPGRIKRLLGPVPA